MMKTFYVAGTTWAAEIEIDTNDLSEEEVNVEVATRALEQHFGKRDDLIYSRCNPINLPSNKQTAVGTQLYHAIINLLNTELEEGCGIGAVLCIMDGEDEKSERFISSKPILENAGLPYLVELFNTKYPTVK